MILKGKIVLPVLNVGPLSIYLLLSFLTCSTGTTGLPKKEEGGGITARIISVCLLFRFIPLFFSSCAVFWCIFYFFIENVSIAILYYST